MKLSTMVAQLPKDVAVDTFRVELAALIKSTGDGFVSQEYLEQIETCIRSYIDRNFEFSLELSCHLDTSASERDISDNLSKLSDFPGDVALSTRFVGNRE
jgi:hypothetical protein